MNTFISILFLGIFFVLLIGFNKISSDREQKSDEHDWWNHYR